MQTRTTNMRLTHFMLKLTGLLAVLTLGCYLWSFSVFFSDNYHSSALLMPMLRYTAHLLPIFIVGLVALWAYRKQDFRWLIIIVLMENIAIFFRISAVWQLYFVLNDWNYFTDRYLLFDYAFLLFMPSAALTFFIGCHQYYAHRLLNLPSILKIICYVLIISVVSTILIMQYTTTVWTPIIYMTAKTLSKQIDIVFFGIFPIFFFSFLAIFCVYSRYYYPLVLHLIFAPHYLLYGTAATIPQIIEALDAIDVLAHSTMYLYIPLTLMFVLAIIVFLISAFFDYKAYISKQRLS